MFVCASPLKQTGLCAQLPGSNLDYLVEIGDVGGAERCDGRITKGVNKNTRWMEAKAESEIFGGKRLRDRADVSSTVANNTVQT